MHRSATKEPVLRFRNHQPSSESLQGLSVERPTVPKVEEQVGTVDIVHNDATQEPLLNLAPKRANWDLKRDLEPQMKKLRALTDRASKSLPASHDLMCCERSTKHKRLYLPALTLRNVWVPSLSQSLASFVSALLPRKSCGVMRAKVVHRRASAWTLRLQSTNSRSLMRMAMNR